MALTLNGTTGLSGIVGSAGTPALQGGDTNTGYFFGTDTLGLSTGGTQRLQIDSSGNIKLGSGATQTLAIKDYGYSGTYKNIMIGNPGSNVGSVGICVDVSTISGGNFAAQHQAILGKNGFLMPNEAGDNYIGVLRRDSSANKLYIGPGISSGLTSGPLTLETSYVGIGTTAPTAELEIFHATDPEIHLNINTHGDVGKILGDADGLTLTGNGSSNQIRFKTNNEHRMRIDSSGRLLKGVLSSEASRSNTSTRNPHVQLSSPWSSGLGSTSITCTDDYPILFINSNANYVDNAGAGVITFSIKDGAGNYCNTAEIRSQIDGSPGNDDSPGELSFRTTADGSCQPTERLKIHRNGNVEINDGDLIIGTAGHGIDFSQTNSSETGVTVDEEVLDHFEEGTWTPTQPTVGWYSGTEIEGKYQRVGHWVTASFIVRFASNASAIAGYIDGLPYVSAGANTEYKYGGSVSYTTDSNVNSFLVENATARIHLYNDTGGGIQLTHLDDDYVRGTVIYRVA